MSDARVHMRRGYVSAMPALAGPVSGRISTSRKPAARLHCST